MAGRRGQRTESEPRRRGSSRPFGWPPPRPPPRRRRRPPRRHDLGEPGRGAPLGAAAASTSTTPPPSRCFLGPIAVATILAVLLMRERRLSAQRERRSGPSSRACAPSRIARELLFGSERQLLISWSGRDGEPRFEGDPSVAGEGATAKRALAFGGWLAPADAAAVEGALDHLRHRGEAFRLTARTLAHSFVDVEGRTLGGNAILRLRDVTGDRSELLRTRADLSASRDDLRAPDGARRHDRASALDPRRGRAPGPGRTRPFCAPSRRRASSDAAARSLELLDRPTREEARRRRAGGGPFDARVAPSSAGRRHVLDVAERPTPTAAPASPSTSPNSNPCAPI